MNTLSLILKEIIHRKMNTLLSLLGVVIAVAFFVAFFTTGQASQRETTRLMRDMGYNLRIIPKETDMNEFWINGYSDQTMPEETINRFASQRGISFVHLLATLQKKIEWKGDTVLLTGIASEVSTLDRKKPPMIFEIPRGKVYLGFEVAQSQGLKAGDSINILGKDFIVEKTLAETGSIDDIRIYGFLEEVQEILGLEDRINEIKALDCLCRDPNRRSIDILREQLADILPEGRVIKIEAIAMAREKQRLMLEHYFALVMPLVVVVCALWIGTLGMMNARERKNEIGILRALGYRSGKIAYLFLGKAFLIGLLGAIMGFWIGTWVALEFGPQIFKVTARSIKPEYILFFYSLVGAPLFAALAMFIPAMVAVTEDPAVALREE